MLSLATIGRWLRSKKVILLLFLILALGSAFRIYDLGTESLWLDESISVHFSGGNVASIIAESGSARCNPPLYWIMLHYWMGLFGTSEAVARSLSAIFGILAILITYLVGRELFSRKVGLIAGFLSAISYFHIYYSQEARPYALLLFLSLLSYFFFIKILKQDKNWYYPCYFLANLFLGYTHVYGLFIIASQIFYFCLLLNKYQLQRRRLIATLVATLIGLSPLSILVGPRAIRVVEHGLWISEPSLRDIFNTFTMYAGYGLGKFILLSLFFLLALLGLFSVRRTEGMWILRKPLDSLKNISWKIGFESVGELLLLIIWLFFPIVIPFISSKVIVPFYTRRYTMGASPALYMLVSKGISTFKMKRVLYSILIFISILSGLGLHSYYVQDVKDQWREVANFVEINSGDDDVIIFYQSYGQRPFDYYYKGDLPEFGILKKADVQEIAIFVDGVVSGKERLWLILSHGGRKKSLMRGYLTDKYGTSIVAEEQFRGIDLLLFDLSSPDLSSYESTYFDRNY